MTSQRGAARRAKITEVETGVQTALGRGQERIQMGGQVSRCDLENPAGSQFRALEYWRGVVGRLFTCIKLSHEDCFQIRYSPFCIIDFFFCT